MGALLVLCASGSARADDAEVDAQVDAHMQRGMERYGEREYEAAIAAFTAAYALEPRPEILFALGQAERLSGDCGSALIYYVRFLETDPEPRQREAAAEQRARCEDALISRPQGVDQVAAAPPPATSSEPAAEPPRPPPTPDVPWHRNSAGVAFASGSAAAGLLGLWAWRTATGAEAQARSADDYRDYDRHIDRARHRSTLAWAAGGVSIGCALAAAWHFRHRAAPRTEASLVAGAGGGGAWIGVAGAF